MRNIIILIIFNSLIHISYGQINTDFLTGKYVYEQEIGGGFMGGPNGECMTRPTDGLIKTIIKIDSNLVVYKVSDTTNNRAIIKTPIDCGCDTLYTGTGQILNDTLIVTYTQKPICPNFFRVINESDKKNEQFEKLPSPIIEKYHIRIEDGLIYGLTYWNDGYEEYIKETNANNM